MPGWTLGPTFVGIDLQESVHVLGEVEDNGVIDGLTGETGAAAAGEDGYAEYGAGDVDGGEDVVLVAGMTTPRAPSGICWRRCCIGPWRRGRSGLRLRPDCVAPVQGPWFLTACFS